MVRRERMNTAMLLTVADIESMEDVHSPQDDTLGQELHHLFDPILSEPIPEGMQQILKAR